MLDITCPLSAVKQESRPIRVFVYGTLKVGFSNYRRLLADKDIKHISAWTYGKLYDLGAFPAMSVEDSDGSAREGDGKVYGDLLEFTDPEILGMIDRLEGYSNHRNAKRNFYNRVVKMIYFENNSSTTAYVYVMSLQNIDVYGGELISSGIWEENSPNI